MVCCDSGRTQSERNTLSSPFLALCSITDVVSIGHDLIAFVTSKKRVGIRRKMEEKVYEKNNRDLEPPC